MIAIALPWVSAKLGQPAVALVDSPLGFDYDDERRLPPAVTVFRIAVPSARFMAQAPDALPGASCFEDRDEAGQRQAMRDWHQWVDRFLMHAITQPRISELEIAALLGPDRDQLAVKLLRLWSWIPEHDEPDCPQLEPGADGIPRCQHFPYLPNQAMQDALRLLASRLRMAPHQVLEMPFDGFVLSWRLLRTPRHEGATVADLIHG